MTKDEYKQIVPKAQYVKPIPFAASYPIGGKPRCVRMLPSKGTFRTITNGEYQSGLGLKTTERKPKRYILPNGLTMSKREMRVRGLAPPVYYPETDKHEVQ